MRFFIPLSFHIQHFMFFVYHYKNKIQVVLHYLVNDKGNE